MSQEIVGTTGLRSCVVAWLQHDIIWVFGLALCLICLADVPLSLALLLSVAQPPPLATIPDAADGGRIEDIMANIKVIQSACSADDDDHGSCAADVGGDDTYTIHTSKHTLIPTSVFRSVLFPFAFLVETAMLRNPVPLLILLQKYVHGATTGKPRLQNLVSVKMGILWQKWER